MKKFFLFSLMAVLYTFAANAKELIINGSFEAKDRSFPTAWMPLTRSGAQVQYFREGGPDNKPFIRLTSPKAPAQLHQTNLKLVKGEKYLVGAWFRTKNAVNRMSGIRVASSSNHMEREGDHLLVGLPENLPQWRYFERVITLPAEEKPLYPYYDVELILDAGGGELDIAGVTLKPMTEIAKRDSKTLMENVAPTLVPLNILYYLPADNAAIEFRWVGPFAGGDPENSECEFYFSHDKKTVKAPFTFDRFKVDFGRLTAKKPQSMRIRIISKTSGKIWYEESYAVRAMNIPQLPEKSRQLNNIVTEVFNGKVKDGETVKITNNRYGFVLFHFDADGGKPFTVSLDGKKLFNEKFQQSEVIRDLDPGVFAVKVSGASGKLQVRLIPDVMTFALMTPRMPGNGRYDWEFAKKYLLPGLTTINVAGFTKEQFAELNQLGRKYLENYGIQNWANPNVPEDDLNRILKSKAFRNPYSHGTTMDESECFYPVMLDPYAYALKKFTNPYDKQVVTYQTGPVTDALLNAISAAANVTGGKSYMAFELYPRGEENMRDVQAMLSNAAQEWNMFRDCAPGLFSKAGVCWGNFSCPPNISLAHYPDIDYKVIIDMKMHAVANDPAFNGVGKVGFWGTYAADEEIARWSFRVMRHYAFEGKKELLSKQYGFALKPGFLKNPAFTDGLKHWDVSGNVVKEFYPGYGKNSIKFHGSKGAGDDFALFTKEPGKVARLSQEAKGLEKGKKYLLYFYVGDYDDVICNRQKISELPLNVTLEDAEITDHTHYNGRATKSNHAYVNIHKIIFTAKDDEVKLTFDNKNAPDGSMLMLNYICLRPYYDKEEL
ncbi:MAG: hypothetical protein E7043_00550 [Lentisphaerae bacterium]|nr:hypothetical protein [Lentisphaerota bacterium]